jgi:major membrane immunogen (membrane-anchored lipoprotein)
MKKLFVIALVALMVLALIAGCGQQKTEPAQQSGGEQQQQQQQQQEQTQPSNNQQATLKDGVYYSEDKDFDDHGWKAMMTVVVKDGKIANVFYDEINKDGLLKSFDPEYAKNMKAKSGATPVLAQTSLAASLLEKQNPDNIDAVTGATHSSDKFKEMVKQTLAGTPVEAKGAFKDGLYKAADKDFDDHGWKGMAAVIIKDGKIASAFYDQINKDDGHYKSTDSEYAKNMEAKSKMTPNKAVEALTKSLLEKQDASQVDAVTGATGTTGNFKTLMGEALSFAK